MKSIGVLAAGMLLACSAPAFADDASKNAKIEEMMRVTHADRMIGQMLDQMKSMMPAQLAKMDLPADARRRSDELGQKMMALIADRLSWEKVKPSYIRIYADTFTEGDIDGILAFYKSPAGQAMLDKMPQLMQASMALSQQLMSDTMPEIQRMVQESIQKK
jgi:hypothetical protein